MMRNIVNTSLLLVLLLVTACKQSGNPQTTKDSENVYVKNNIQSYEVTKTRIGSDGLEDGQIIKNVEFDRNGNILKDISVDINYTTTYIYTDSLLTEMALTDSEGTALVTTKIEYIDNQVIEKNFDENNEPNRIRTLFKDKEGRDTLSIYTTADNVFLYKLVNHYDAIGLKESIMYYSDDTTYTQRTNDDKRFQLFETRKKDGKLIVKEAKTFDDKGNEIEFFYENVTDPNKRDTSHHKTSYKENGLIDNVTFFDSDGNSHGREYYEYKTFEKE